MGKSTQGNASSYAETKVGSGATAEFANLIENDAPPGYRSTEGSPRLSTATIVSSALKEGDVEPAYPTRTGKCSPKTFNKQVVMVIIGYGILA
jgi:hypothetical protein